MMKISDLQSQVALNRRNISFLEGSLQEVKSQISSYHKTLEEADQLYPHWKLNMKQYVDQYYKDLARGRKWIAKYAKLQRALKSELAYRIRCNRMTREVEAITEKAKTEGWEVVIVDDDTYNEMLKENKCT